VLVTHEHLDHNGTDAISGSPPVLRSTAGTERGPDTIFVFELDGARVAHFGDFGQSDLRDEQAAAIGQVDLLFLPVGGGPTIGAEQAAQIAERLGPRWVVPMHYRTPRVSFLETADAFLERMPDVHQLDQPSFETGDLPGEARPLVVVPAAP
jgi:L-ascorbate metabolism protein UlaG (beta-lactamase superfamily)